MESKPVAVANDTERPALRIDSQPDRVGTWLSELWASRSLLVAMARKDFRARYKRASLGAVWAVAVPLLQAIVISFVFSRVARFGEGEGFSYAGFVLAGMVAWFYVATTVPLATTAIVDGSAIADKIWFSRAVLALVPAVANLITLAVSTVILLVALPIVGEPFTLRLFALVPGVLLLFAFCSALGMVLAALNTYFRDVKYMVQAAILLWFYASPVVYPATALGDTANLLDYNPLTGILGVFQWAAVDAPSPSGTALAVSIGTTLVLALGAVEGYRRHDRLFVDLL